MLRLLGVGGGRYLIESGGQERISLREIFFLKSPLFWMLRLLVVLLGGYLIESCQERIILEGHLLPEKSPLLDVKIAGSSIRRIPD